MYDIFASEMMVGTKMKIDRLPRKKEETTLSLSLSLSLSFYIYIYIYILRHWIATMTFTHHLKVGA